MRRSREANGGHQISYGEDVYTAELMKVMRGHFGEQAEVFPVFNGTGANVTALTSVMPRWGAVISTSTAHIHTDEGGAPERISGLKLLTVDSPDGKLTPDLIETQAWGWGDEHRVQPAAVSITQTTELGTLYSVAEVRAIADYVHARGMVLHMDGARISNAAAALGVPLREFTTDAGVDILSFGGTKNGMLYGEAIVVLDPSKSDGLIYLRKLNMQLASKMRFVSAQFLALLTDDLYLKSAAHANDDGGAPARCARCRASPTVRSRACRSARRPRPTPCSRFSTTRRPTASASASGSTTGTALPARCAGCARTTPPRPTSTVSSRRSPRSSRVKPAVKSLSHRPRGYRPTHGYP